MCVTKTRINSFIRMIEENLKRLEATVFAATRKYAKKFIVEREAKQEDNR